MRQLHTPLAAAGLLAAAALLAASCTSSPDAVGSASAASGISGPAGTSASVAAPVVVPPLTSAPLPTAAPSAPGTTSPRTSPADATTSSRPPPPTVTTSPRTTIKPVPTTPRTGTRAASVPTADLNAAGPDAGPVCAVAPQYSDEAPTGLRPDVRSAWVAIEKAAKNQGVTLCLNDGKRSTAQQLALYDDYVKEFGRAAADVYVLPPAKSAHVKGYAVDVQPAAGYQWLQATRGARGWCRIYDNEPWHFEYSRGYQTTGCPARLPKPVR